MIQICYLLAAVLFIFGLKFMAHPRTAVRGNRLGAAAMALAIANKNVAVEDRAALPPPDESGRVG